MFVRSESGELGIEPRLEGSRATMVALFAGLERNNGVIVFDIVKTMVVSCYCENNGVILKTGTPVPPVPAVAFEGHIHTTTLS